MRRFLMLLCLLLNATAGAAEQNLLFILDASGSMWGHVEGTPKISVAKQVMSGLVRDLPGDSQAGMLAYGHRRKGDCNDIEFLVELKPLERKALIEHIQGLNPKGKTPITGAVKQAVGQLRQLESSASVVLVSDGLESCGGDPCEAVKAAKQTGVDFRMHVIGFDLGETDTSQLQCMAKVGGGEYYTAANAEELTGALEKAVQVQPGLILEVTRNGERTPARVFVYRAGTKEEVKRDTLGDSAEGYNSNPLRLGLAAAEYDVKVVPEEVEGASERFLTGIEIPAEGEVRRSVDFSSGSVELTVTANGKPLDARTYIQHADSGKEAARDGTNGKGIARYSVPVGTYRIKVRPDGIDAPDRFIENVQVNAGQTTHKSLDYASGTVVVNVTTNGEPLDARTYIQQADSGREAARGSTNGKGVARYSVPVGTYRIKVRPDGIDAADRFIKDVIVRSGETTNKHIDFASGTVRVKVTHKGQPLDARTYIQHADSGREAARDSTNGKGRAGYTVPVGTYRIKVRPDGIDAADRFIQDIRVEAATTTEVSLDFAEPEVNDEKARKQSEPAEAPPTDAADSPNQAAADPAGTGSAEQFARRYWRAIAAAGALAPTQRFRAEGMAAHDRVQAVLSRDDNGRAADSVLNIYQRLTRAFRLERIETEVAADAERRLRLHLRGKQDEESARVTLGLVQKAGEWRVAKEDWD